MTWPCCCLGRTPTPDDGEDADENEVVFMSAEGDGHDGKAAPAAASTLKTLSKADAKKVLKVMKGPPQVSEAVAVVIVQIMDNENVFAEEVEAAKTAPGGATPAILKMAAEQATAAAGAIYCTVVTLRRQYAENGGKEGVTDGGRRGLYTGTKELKLIEMAPKLKAAEASLVSILRVVVEEWKLKLDDASSSSSPPTAAAFEKLEVAEAGPGVATMLSVIGAQVIAHHQANAATDPADVVHYGFKCYKSGMEPIVGPRYKNPNLVDMYQVCEAEFENMSVHNKAGYKVLPPPPWFQANTLPPALDGFVEAYFRARNVVVRELVPNILLDVELYGAEAKLQADAAGPGVLARLAAVTKAPNVPPLTTSQIADLTAFPAAAAAAVPGAKTLARLSYDQHIACGGSIVLYKQVSEVVAGVASKLSTPGVVLPGAVKGKERTIYKSGLKYHGNTTKCHDKIRCTVELATLEDIAVVAEALVSMPSFLAVKVKNRFDPEYDSLPIGGYRDMQFSGLVELAGAAASAGAGPGPAYAWCEIQLNTTRMIALKSGNAKGQAGAGSSGSRGGGSGKGGKAGHIAFNVARAINAFAPESFVHAGEWSSDVAERVKAGLLLEVNLSSTTFKDAAQRAEFVEALCSKECRVRKLAMRKMELGEDDGAAIGEVLKVNTTLTSIDLQQNKLGEVGGAAIYEALKVNTTLTSINLQFNKLGEVGGAAIYEALKVNTTLTSINLQFNKLGEVAGVAIGEALKVNTTLTSINLQFNKLGEVAGVAIGEALKVNTTLTSIDLRGNNLGEVGGAAIGEALKVNTTLTSIDLRGNTLGEVGGAAIGEALKVNTTLTSIILVGNTLGEVGGAAIGEALKVNTTLTSINMYDNKLGEVGGAAIGEALKVNTTLTSIILVSNTLGEVGGAAIGEALKVNTTLTSINMHDNKLGEVAGAAIGEALKVNTTLTSIILGGNGSLPNATETAIVAAVAKNKAAAK
eukprot:gene8124-biopygen266